MSKNVLEMNNYMAVKGDSEDVLGKLVYFSLSRILIKREDILELCDNMDISAAFGKRTSTVDAFKSATGDVYERFVRKTDTGQLIQKVYCRDNQKNGDVYSRELVMETLNENTNRYQKLANITCDKDTDTFDYFITSASPGIDIADYCIRARELFELYRECVRANQLETLIDNLLDQMERLKINVHGRLYFIPKKHMQKLNLFEDFIEALGTLNINKDSINCNSIFVVDDEKQRKKMTTEFYAMAKKEIEMYNTKLENLISNGVQNQSIVDRWLLKISSFEKKIAYYETLLKQELDDFGEEYQLLKLMADELSRKSRVA